MAGTGDAGEAWLVSNGSGTIALCGGSTRALVGWSPEALVGRSLHATLHGGPESECRACTAPGGTVVFTRQDGRPATLPYARVPLTGDDGCVLHVLGESAHREALRRDFETFAYAVSHDLLEPLRAVSGFVTLLDRRYRDKLDPEAEEYIDFAVAGARRVQALLDALLAYSRVATRGRPPAPVSAREALDEALRNLAPKIAEAKARLSIGDLPTVNADTPQLVQLFQALLDNALKFRGPSALEIAVFAKRSSAGWTFAVEDNGIGIPAEHAEDVFRLFRQLEPRDRASGVGAGLAMAKRIVERHAGTIRAEPRPGGGTRLVFTLPS